MIEDELEEAGSPEATKPITYSVNEAAEKAGVTGHTIRRAVKAGIMKRCNANKKQPPRFSEEELLNYIASRDTDAGPTALATLQQQGVTAEVQRADAMTNMVSQAQGHTEHAWDQTRQMVIEFRRGASDMLGMAHTENEKLRERIGKLEVERDDVVAAADKLREHLFSEKIAEGVNAANLKKTEAAMQLLRLLAPAVISRFAPGAKDVALGTLFESINEEQTALLMQACAGILNADQQTALFLTLQRFDAKNRSATEVTTQ